MMKKLTGLALATLMMISGLTLAVAEDIAVMEQTSAPVTEAVPEAIETPAPEAPKAEVILEAPAAEILPEAAETAEAVQETTVEETEITSDAMETEAKQETPQQVAEQKAVVEEQTQQETLPVAEEAAVERSVCVKVQNPKAAIGETVTLELEMSGYEGLNYTITWQYSVNGSDWQTAPGNTDSNSYSFKLTEENNGWYYRATVDVHE